MAGARFELDDKDIDRLVGAIKQYEGNAEQALGNYLENEADKIFRPSIENLIPVSDKDKKHARTSAPLTGDMEGNLSLYIHTKKAWHYLYFPDEGEGTSKGQLPHDFMNEGIEKQYDTVINGMLDALINEWDKQ